MGNNPIVADKLPEVKRRPVMDNFVRPALVIIMAMCLGIALVNFVRAVNPTWHGGYFLFGLTLVAIEAVYSSRLLISYGYQRYESVIRFRLVEWGILLLLLKLISFAGKSANEVLVELKTIGSSPEILLSGDFLAFVVLAGIIWTAVSQTITDFENLYDPYQFRQATLAPYQNLTQRFFWGGGIIVVLSGFSRWMTVDSYESLLNLGRDSLGGVIFNVLVYFVAGLVLLSQAQLTALFTRWEIQEVSVSSGLARRWIKYGLVVLGLVSAVIFFLPTSYTMGFLNSVGLLIAFFIGFVLSILQLIMLLITLVLLWLASLFGPEGEEPPLIPTPTPTSQPQLINPPALPPDFSWLELARSLAFWIIALGIIIYLIRTYLKDHPEILTWFKNLRLFKLSFGWLGRLWQWLTGAIQAGVDMIPRRVNLPGTGTNGNRRQPWRWPRLGSMSPREQILYYYLNILKRAERAGTPRKASQTPSEFAHTLNQTIPEAEGETSLLTDSFIQARYSRHTFDTEQAGLIKTIWQHIRTALRNLNQQK